MASPKHDPSVNAEPHLAKQKFSADGSEEKVAQELAQERAHTDPTEERAKHSVFDEPATLPNRPAALIDRDWHCRNCDYNLRGLMTGHPCPECGRIEHYEPPRGSEVTYMQWVDDHAVEVSPQKSWLIAIIVPILGAPFALGCALFTVEYFGLMHFVLVAPIASEVLKIAIASIVVERRSHLIRRESQLYVMILGTAAVFAVVQNLIYLLLYFSSPPPPIELIAYRWLIGPLAHIISAAIAAHGITLVWKQAKEQKREPRLTRAYPWVIAAIVVHGLYNLCVYANGHLGYGF